MTEAVPMDLIESKTFGAGVVTSATGVPATSRTDTAVRAIGASPTGWSPGDAILEPPLEPIEPASHDS